MPRPKRIRRTLAIQVSEPQVDGPGRDNTPGQRFAEGWAHFLKVRGREPNLHELSGDPVKIAGFLAAGAAWEAHFNAINWLDVRGD